MTPNTIDSRIREMAAKEFRASLVTLLKPVRAANFGPSGTIISSIPDKAGYSNPAKAKNPDDRFASVATLLQEVENAIYSARIGQVQDEAVAAFIKKVEGLQNQLDEIQSQLPG